MKTTPRLLGFLLLIAIGIWVVPVLAGDENLRQQADLRQFATATPGSVQLPTSTATATPPAPTATRTPTSQGPALIEAKNPDTNVRSGPDITNDRLGQIQPGERYVVTGRRFKWLRIQYPNTPTGVAWVFEDVVNIIGEADLIPELDLEQLPTIDPTEAANQETLIAATLTPGGVLTLTAQAFVTPQGVFTLDPAATRPTLAPGERLPTFTFPPFTNTPIPIGDIQAPPPSNSNDSTQFAPAIPILGLAALGLLGIFIGIFRRL